MPEKRVRLPAEVSIQIKAPPQSYASIIAGACAAALHINGEYASLAFAGIQGPGNAGTPSEIPHTYPPYRYHQQA